MIDIWKDLFALIIIMTFVYAVTLAVKSSDRQSHTHCHPVLASDQLGSSIALQHLLPTLLGIR